jgi:hypothetical protein
VKLAATATLTSAAWAQTVTASAATQEAKRKMDDIDGSLKKYDCANDWKRNYAVSMLQSTLVNG